MIVIPAEAGIQKNRDWMPHQVRHDMTTKSKEALDALHWRCSKRGLVVGSVWLRHVGLNLDVCLPLAGTFGLL